MRNKAIFLECDKFYKPYEPVVTELQTQFYLANESNYFQGLRTHSEGIPADGVWIAPDRINANDKPEGKVQPWPRDLFPPTMPCALTIDNYNGVNGRGFIVTLSVYIKNILYQRAIDYGAAGFSHDWQGG